MTYNKFFGILFIEIASKREKFSPNFSSFNPFPSLPSVATNDRNQNKLQNLFLNNKPRQLYYMWNSVEDKSYLGFQIAWHSPFKNSNDSRDKMDYLLERISCKLKHFTRKVGCYESIKYSMGDIIRKSSYYWQMFLLLCRKLCRIQTRNPRTLTIHLWHKAYCLQDKEVRG